MVFNKMVIKNAKSNPYYYFIEVTGTREEIVECINWCSKTFGPSNHSHCWYTTELPPNSHSALDAESNAILHRIRAQSLNYNPTSRFMFTNESQRNWFIMRWS
jgi:hypothetical protein